MRFYILLTTLFCILSVPIQNTHASTEKLSAMYIVPISMSDKDAFIIQNTNGDIHLCENKTINNNCTSIGRHDSADNSMRSSAFKPLIYDYNSDGNPDVIFGKNYSANNKTVPIQSDLYIYDLCRLNEIGKFTTKSNITGKPIMLDIDQDSKLDIVVGYYNNIKAKSELKIYLQKGKTISADFNGIARKNPVLEIIENKIVYFWAYYLSKDIKIEKDDHEKGKQADSDETENTASNTNMYHGTAELSTNERRETNESSKNNNKISNKDITSRIVFGEINSNEITVNSIDIDNYRISEELKVLRNKIDNKVLLLAPTYSSGFILHIAIENKDIFRSNKEIKLNEVKLTEDTNSFDEKYISKILSFNNNTSKSLLFTSDSQTNNSFLYIYDLEELLSSASKEKVLELGNHTEPEYISHNQILIPATTLDSNKLIVFDLETGQYKYLEKYKNIIDFGSSDKNIYLLDINNNIIELGKAYPKLKYIDVNHYGLRSSLSTRKRIIQMLKYNKENFEDNSKQAYIRSYLSKYPTDRSIIDMYDSFKRELALYKKLFARKDKLYYITTGTSREQRQKLVDYEILPQKTIIIYFAQMIVLVLIIFLILLSPIIYLILKNKKKNKNIEECKKSIKKIGIDTFKNEYCNFTDTKKYNQLVHKAYFAFIVEQYISNINAVISEINEKTFSILSKGLEYDYTSSEKKELKEISNFVVGILLKSTFKIRIKNLFKLRTIKRLTMQQVNEKKLLLFEMMYSILKIYAINKKNNKYIFKLIVMCYYTLSFKENEHSYIYESKCSDLLKMLDCEPDKLSKNIKKFLCNKNIKTITEKISLLRFLCNNTSKDTYKNEIETIILQTVYKHYKISDKIDNKYSIIEVLSENNAFDTFLVINKQNNTKAILRIAKYSEIVFDDFPVKVEDFPLATPLEKPSYQIKKKRKKIVFLYEEYLDNYIPLMQLVKKGQWSEKKTKLLLLSLIDFCNKAKDKKSYLLNFYMDNIFINKEKLLKDELDFRLCATEINKLKMDHLIIADKIKLQKQYFQTPEFRNKNTKERSLILNDYFNHVDYEKTCVYLLGILVSYLEFSIDPPFEPESFRTIMINVDKPSRLIFEKCKKTRITDRPELSLLRAEIEEIEPFLNILNIHPKSSVWTNELYGREDEISMMIHNVNTNNHTMIIAPKRAGKTTLVQYVKHTLRANNNSIQIYIDFDSITIEESDTLTTIFYILSERIYSQLQAHHIFFNSIIKRHTDYASNGNMELTKLAAFITENKKNIKVPINIFIDSTDHTLKFNNLKNLSSPLKSLINILKENKVACTIFVVMTDTKKSIANIKADGFDIIELNAFKTEHLRTLIENRLLSELVLSSDIYDKILNETNGIPLYALHVIYELVVLINKNQKITIDCNLIEYVMSRLNFRQIDGIEGIFSDIDFNEDLDFWKAIAEGSSADIDTTYRKITNLIEANIFKENNTTAVLSIPFYRYYIKSRIK